MSGVNVEPAGPQDLAAMEALLTANQLPTAGLRESLGTALVARVGSRTIGSVALEIYPSGVLLRSVAVDSAWRGRGIGHQLTRAGLDLARSLGDLGLIDEYQLYLHAVVLGRGKPFFAGPRPPLRLVASDLIGEDAIRLRYVPA